MMNVLKYLLLFVAIAVTGCRAARERLMEPVNITEMIEQDFTAVDPDYVLHRDMYNTQLRNLQQDLEKLQQEGYTLPCSEQLWLESHFTWTSTADWDRLEDQLTLTADSLKNLNQSWANEQSPDDGCWGSCYMTEELRMDASIERLGLLADQKVSPKYPVLCFGPVGLLDTEKNPIETMKLFLDNRSNSDIAKTKKNKRDLFNGGLTLIAQMVFKNSLRKYINSYVKGFAVSKEYESAFQEWIQAEQHRSGFWGESFLHRGVMYDAADLSVTFHSVSYSKGAASRPDMFVPLVRTLLSIENGSYPYGFKTNGSLNTHNLYDVAKILRYSWDQIDDQLRAQTRAMLFRTLHWVLENSVSPSGEFLRPSAFSSVSDMYYFGVSYFDQIGYWRSDQCFWTPFAFEGHELCCNIGKTLSLLHLTDPSALGAMELLKVNCPDCV